VKELSVWGEVIKKLSSHRMRGYDIGVLFFKKGNGFFIFCFQVSCLSLCWLPSQFQAFIFVAGISASQNPFSIVCFAGLGFVFVA